MIDHIRSFYGTIHPGRADGQTGADTFFGGQSRFFIKMQNVAAAPEGTVEHILFAGSGIFYNIGVDCVDRKRVACFQNASLRYKRAFGSV